MNYYLQTFDHHGLGVTTYLENITVIESEIAQVTERIEYYRIHMEAAFYNVLVLSMDRFSEMAFYLNELQERANTYREYRSLHQAAQDELKELKLQKRRLYVSQEI